LPSYRVIAADTLRDLVTLTFDLGQWSYMAGHVVNPSTKFEDPYGYPVLSYEFSHIGYHWQCVNSHCACAVSRDLCV